MTETNTTCLSALDWQRWAIHIAGVLPALWIIVLGLADELTVNPYQAVEQRTGRIALIFLMLALACTPANLVLGWRQAIWHRRTLGLYAFAYASLHLLILVGLDYGWSFRLLRADLDTKPFIWVGAVGAADPGGAGRHLVRRMEAPAGEELETSAPAGVRGGPVGRSPFRLGPQGESDVPERRHRSAAGVRRRGRDPSHPPAAGRPKMDLDAAARSSVRSRQDTSQRAGLSSCGGTTSPLRPGIPPAPPSLT